MKVPVFLNPIAMYRAGRKIQSPTADDAMSSAMTKATLYAAVSLFFLPLVFNVPVAVVAAISSSIQIFLTFLAVAVTCLLMLSYCIIKFLQNVAVVIRLHTEKTLSAPSPANEPVTPKPVTTTDKNVSLLKQTA